LTCSPAPAEAAPYDPDASSRPVGVAAVVAAVGIMLVAANLRPAVVSVAPLVDEIKASTGWSSSVTGLLTTLPVLVFGLAAPVAPRCAARFGIERTVFGALALLVAAILLRLLPAPVALFFGSALVGAGIGVCNVVLPSLIKRDFAHRSGLMTGLYSMTLTGGAAAAAALTVPINDAVGGNWRVTLASWGVFALVALVVWVPQLSRLHRVEIGSGRESLWRNRIAWAITIFMAAQAMIFYTFAAWLPEYLIGRGISPAGAGGVLALGQVAALVMSLIAPIIASRFRDQRAVTGVVLLVCGLGFAGLLFTDRWPTVWVMCVMSGPGASISLALLFMVLRSASTTQTSQVSGMAQSVGYILAAVGPAAIGALHDVTGSWTISMSALALALIPQAVSTMVAGKNVTMGRRFFER
jgi:MFS transporter, CP family, cyanate transporter